MRLIDADELMEHVWRDKLDSRELIAKMVEGAPTVKEIPTKIPLNYYEKLLSLIERANIIDEKIDKQKEDISPKYEAKVITRGNCMMCGKELTEGLFFCKECEAKAIQSRK